MRTADPFHYSNRVCPKLSVAAAGVMPRAERSLLAGTLPPPPRLPTAPCLGPACMHFVPDADREGNIVGGSCADTLNAISLNQVLGVLAQRFLPAVERLSPPPPPAVAADA